MCEQVVSWENRSRGGQSRCYYLAVITIIRSGEGGDGINWMLSTTKSHKTYEMRSGDV